MFFPRYALKAPLRVERRSLGVGFLCDMGEEFVVVVDVVVFLVRF